MIDSPQIRRRVNTHKRAGELRMELRSSKMGKGKEKGKGAMPAGGKDMKLRILLASIGLTVYAAQLEAAEIGAYRWMCGFHAMVMRCSGSLSNSRCLLACLPACLPGCLAAWLPGCLAVSVCLSVCLAARLPACLSVCLSVCERAHSQERVVWMCRAALPVENSLAALVCLWFAVPAGSVLPPPPALVVVALLLLLLLCCVLDRVSSLAVALALAGRGATREGS